MQIKVIITMILSVLLSSGSFFLDDYLTEKLNNNHYSKDDLSYGLMLKLDAAYKIKLTELELGTESWLNYGKVLAKGNGQISKKIADYYFQQGEFETSIIWYQQAIKLLDYSAALPLAKAYFIQNKLALAHKTLENVKSLSATDVLFAIELAIAQGDTFSIAKYIDMLSSSEIGKTLVDKIIKYQVLSGANINQTFNNANYSLNELQNKALLSEQSCPTSIQLYATTLADLDQLSEFIKQFKQYPLNEYLCLSQPKYIPIKQLHCHHNKTKAIKCDEGTWQSFTQHLNTRYIGLLYPHGGANVHLGILYIDREDTFDVFSHEITHLLGFVDEYPLVTNHPRCHQTQTAMFAQNIAVLDKKYYGDKKEIRNNIIKSIPWGEKIKPTTPILTFPVNLKNELLNTFVKENTWLLGTPNTYKGEYGVFNADTCNEGSFRSYKPLKRITQLQYYQVEFPNQYLDLLANNWYEYLMPSFHYNIALSLLVKGDLVEGRTWLLKSASMESKSARKLKILQAKF